MLKFLVGFRKFVAFGLVLTLVIMVEGVFLHLFLEELLGPELLLKSWEISVKLITALGVAFVSANVGEHVVKATEKFLGKKKNEK